METDTLSSQRLKGPILSVPKLKVEPQEESSSQTSKVEKVVDLLEYNGGENLCYDEYIKSAFLEKIKNEKEELDHKESDLCLKESSYIKWETRTFQKIPIEFNDRNIDKKFGNNVMEPNATKKETDGIKKVADEGLNCIHENSINSEIIKQEEVHIKDENVEDSLNKKIPKSNKQTVLHQCPECPYSTHYKSHLKSHSIRHKKVDEIDWFSCQECPYKTCRKKNLECHTEIHNNVILKCSICSYETLRSTEFKKHEIEHDSSFQWLHCSECSFKSRVQSYLQKHLLTHKRNTFKCTKCPYQTGRKDLLSIHQIKHGSMDKWHSCPLCSFKSHIKKAFEVHCRRRHSVDPNNPKQIEIFKCTECFYESGHKGDLKTHQLIHDQSRWYQCPDCAFKTPHKRRLKGHQVRHQGENAEGWHRCLQCSYKTLRKYELRKHVISHKSDNEIRRFECSQCSFKTLHKDNLRRHQLKHKEEHEIEWFFCYECSYKTIYKSVLQNHIPKHKKRNGQKLFTK